MCKGWVKKNCLKYFTDYGLRNAFLPLDEIADAETQSWIAKSKHELNRYGNYLCLLGRYGKDRIAIYSIQAVHETIAACSAGIVFSLFNIFAILTKTEKTFYDSHIQEYFSEKMKIQTDDLNYLTFQWHDPVEKINSLVYSVDEALKFSCSGEDLMFQITKTNTKQYAFSIIHENSEGFISSKEFFAVNLLNLLAAIDVLAALLYKEVITGYGAEPSEVAEENYHIRIENIDELKSIFRKS